jgi:hypothetical protein
LGLVLGLFLRLLGLGGFGLGRHQFGEGLGRFRLFWLLGTAVSDLVLDSPIYIKFLEIVGHHVARIDCVDSTKTVEGGEPQELLLLSATEQKVLSLVGQQTEGVLPGASHRASRFLVISDHVDVQNLRQGYPQQLF